MVSPLPTIVTLAQAKKAARITSDAENDDLYVRLEIAHELCLDYVNNRVDDADAWLETILTWDVDNAPKRVKGAILHTFVHLTRFRGDDTEKDNAPQPGDHLPPMVRAMLDRLRDPTVA